MIQLSTRFVALALNCALGTLGEKNRLFRNHDVTHEDKIGNISMKYFTIKANGF